MHSSALRSFVLMGLLLLGCNPPGEGRRAAQHRHEHPEQGPHGGVLADWGKDEYHVEFTVDHDKKQTTVYILDVQAKNAVPIKTDAVTVVITNVSPPLKIVLKPEPQADEPAGSSSRFVGTDDKLGVEMDFKGEISAEVNGKAYAGKFEEHDHDTKKGK